MQYYRIGWQIDHWFASRMRVYTQVYKLCVWASATTHNDCDWIFFLSKW